MLFALVGASSTTLDVALFWLLIDLAQVPPLPANAVSYSLAAANSFLLNKFITFRHRKAQRGSVRQVAIFVLVRLTCLAVSSLVLAAALSLLSSLAAKLVSVAVTFTLAYTLSSRLVFR